MEHATHPLTSEPPRSSRHPERGVPLRSRTLQACLPLPPLHSREKRPAVDNLFSPSSWFLLYSESLILHFRLEVTRREEDTGHHGGSLRSGDNPGSSGWCCSGDSWLGSLEGRVPRGTGACATLREEPAPVAQPSSVPELGGAVQWLGTGFFRTALPTPLQPPGRQLCCSACRLIGPSGAPPGTPSCPAPVPPGGRHCPPKPPQIPGSVFYRIDSAFMSYFRLQVGHLSQPQTSV